MLNKKILILGASELQEPLIIKAKEKGYTLGIVDYNKEAVCVKYADKFYNVSTKDEYEVYRVAKEFEPDAIVTMATDLPIRTIAYVSSKLNLKSIDYDTSLKATNKGFMIKALEKAGVPHPRYRIIKEKATDEDLEYIKNNLPCICKPTENSGSRGVILINKKDDIQKCLEYSFKLSNGEVIIQEYMVGKEVSVEILCVGKIPEILAITDKMTTGQPHFVELGHSQPSKFNNFILKDIERISKLACEALGLENTAAHVEIMVTLNGPKIVELGARMGGDFITSHLVPLSTGIDMIDLVLEQALGKNVEIKAPLKKGACIRYFDKVKDEKVFDLDIKTLKEKYKVSGIEKIKIYDKSVESIKSSNDRLGYVITTGKNVNEAIRNAEKLLLVIKGENN